MWRRPTALFVVASLAAALLASATAGAAGPPAGVVQVAAPSDPEERVVGYRQSQLLLIRPAYADRPGITRINLDGSVDRSFGEEGTVEIASEDATVTRDGKILVSTSSHPTGAGGNSDARVTRLLPDGQPDSSFGVGGTPLGRLREVAALGASQARLDQAEAHRREQHNELVTETCDGVLVRLEDAAWGVESII